MSNINSSIWPKDVTLYGTTTPGQSGSGSHVDEAVLNISQSIWNVDSPEDFWHIQHRGGS